MSGIRRFFGISESADKRIDELLDDLDELEIKYSIEEFNSDISQVSGVNIIHWLMCKILKAFRSDFEQCVEEVDGNINLYEFVVDICTIDGDCWFELSYKGTPIIGTFIDSYISGDRDFVFAKLLEKCRELDEIQ